MGTRNLTVVQHNGEYKVAKYCQWDGYPSGQGATILDFLINRFDKQKFIANLDKCYTDQDKLDQMWKDAGSDPETGMIEMRKSEAFTKIHPQLGREMGGDVLEFIQDSTADSILLPFDIEFAQDGLFCEWCYIIDLDKDTLEVYTGFHKETLEYGTRFGTEPDERGYLPVQLLAQYPLASLPTLDQFIQDCTDDDEDDFDPSEIPDHQVNPRVLIEKTHDFFQVAIEQSGQPDLAKLLADYLEYSMDEFLEYAENKSS